MIKKIICVSLIVALTACSNKPKDSESDYKYSLSESAGIIAVAKDKAVTCKGMAMIDHFEEASKCTEEFVKISQSESDYHAAANELFMRIKIDKSRLDDPQYMLLLGDIDRVGKTQDYLLSYMQSKK